MKLPSVPLRSHELELPLQMRADQEEDAAPLGAVILEHALRQGRPVVRAAPQEVVKVDCDNVVVQGVARIDPTNVRAAWHRRPTDFGPGRSKLFGNNADEYLRGSWGSRGCSSTPGFAKYGLPSA